MPGDTAVVTPLAAAMEPDQAAFWLDTIASIMALIWLLARWFVTTTTRTVASPSTGRVVVDRPATSVLDAAAVSLSQGVSNSPLHRIRLEQRTASSLRWVGEFRMGRHEGSLQVEPREEGRCEALWTVRMDARATRGARLVSTIGLFVLVGVYALLRGFVLEAEHPAVRAQVLQMVQAIHVLWPPFLLAGLVRLMRRRIGHDLERLLANQSFQVDSASR